MSTKPGVTSSPSASTSRVPRSSTFADCGDRGAGHGDVAPVRRCTRPIDDRAVADDEISHAHNAATRQPEPPVEVNTVRATGRGGPDDVSGDPVGDGARGPGGDQGDPGPSRARAGRCVGAQPGQGGPGRRGAVRSRSVGGRGDGRPSRDLRDRRGLRRLRAGARQHAHGRGTARVGQERRHAGRVDLPTGVARRPRCSRTRAGAAAPRCTAPASTPAASPNGSR